MPSCSQRIACNPVHLIPPYPMPLCQKSESHLLSLPGSINILYFWPDRRSPARETEPVLTLSPVNRVRMLLEKVGDAIPETHRVKGN